MSGSGRRTKRKQLTWKTKGELVISGAAHNTTHRHTRADAFSFFSLSPPTLLFHFGPPSPPPPLALMRTRRMGKHSGKKERVRGESILSEFLPPFAQFRTMEAEALLINLGTSQQHTHTSALSPASHSQLGLGRSRLARLRRQHKVHDL